jgi:POT family proton-dependent oligopeptide transporter
MIRPTAHFIPYEGLTKRLPKLIQSAAKNGESTTIKPALSAVSKLSPRRFAGQMMGVFVLTYSIGNIIAGLLAGNFDPDNLNQLPNLYIQISLFSIGIGIVILLVSFKSRFWESLPDESENSDNNTENKNSVTA